MILKYLKNQLLEGKFSNSMRGQVNASDFEWVITVPAMWRSRGKQMMREAAYKVHTCTVCERVIINNNNV